MDTSGDAGEAVWLSQGGSSWLLLQGALPPREAKGENEVSEGVKRGGRMAPFLLLIESQLGSIQS